GIPTIINPEDKNALEAALSLKEKYEGEVIVISMGPPQADEALREALAMGADRAILLTDRAFAGADTMATAYSLGSAVKKIGEYDLILCGRQAIDGVLYLLLKPIAKILSYGVAAVDPAFMGIGPVYAIPKALERAGLKLEDMDLIELNEAFAAQVLAVNKELHFNHDKLNVNGGAIALGHPVGCSGARIIVTLLYEMKDRDAKYGLAALCVGGGQGAAMVVERM
ncbi:unnamed protein product, partial [marine sediment metagenome]